MQGIYRFIRVMHSSFLLYLCLLSSPEACHDGNVKRIRHGGQLIGIINIGPKPVNYAHMPCNYAL